MTSLQLPFRAVSLQYLTLIAAAEPARVAARKEVIRVNCIVYDEAGIFKWIHVSSMMQVQCCLNEIDALHDSSAKSVSLIVVLSLSD